MWAAQKPNFGKDLMCTSRIFEPMHVNTMRAALTGVRRYHRRASLGISLAKAIRVHFRLAQKSLMGLQMFTQFVERNYFGNTDWELCTQRSQ